MFPMGYNVMVDAHWPRDHVADAVYSYRWHPFWQWLARVLHWPAPLTMERGHAILRDRDMIMAGRDIYCSPRQFEELKRAIAAQH